MRFVLAVLLTVSFAPVVGVISASDASAQATCRQKCNDAEQACLKRTNNKSQCGNRAKPCLAKCK